MSQQKRVSNLQLGDRFLFRGEEFKALEGVRSYGDGSYAINAHNLTNDGVGLVEFDEELGNPVVDMVYK